MSLADSILGADDRKLERVELADLGWPDVWVGRFSTAERAAFRKWWVSRLPPKPTGDGIDAAAADSPQPDSAIEIDWGFLVWLGAYEQDGTRIFNDLAQIEPLNRKCGAALERIGGKILQLNLVTAEDVAEKKSNSGTTQSCSSNTSLPSNSAAPSANCDAGLTVTSG